jgi:hypothetical protein
MTRTQRTLSWSEISMALTCEAQHAYAYTGHLSSGHCFKPREMGVRLSDGRAFGAAVATWHAFERDDSLLGASSPMLARMAAHGALRASYAHDIAEQGELGTWMSPDVQVEREDRLAMVLDDYMTLAYPLENLTRVEGLLDVPIPSRTRSSSHASTRYRFEGYLDGFTIDERANEWLFECKLRDSLTPVWQLQLSRQLLWYAFCLRRETGRPLVGAIIEERLSDAPKPARLVKAKSKSEPQDERGMTPSHAKDQLCTVEAYVALCAEYGVEPHPETMAVLEARIWQQRVPLLFDEAQLEEAGRELVSAAQLISELDSGKRYPIRNAQPRLCRSCRWRQICPTPQDLVFAETLYEFVPPKRLRDPKDKVQRTSAGSSTPHSASRVHCSSYEAPTLGAEAVSAVAAQSFTDARSGSHPVGANFDFAHATYAETECWHFNERVSA